jgi:hypothetical protein
MPKDGMYSWNEEKGDWVEELRVVEDGLADEK